MPRHRPASVNTPSAAAPALTGSESCSTSRCLRSSRRANQTICALNNNSSNKKPRNNKRGLKADSYHTFNEFTGSQSKDKITPTRQNGSVKNMSGEWEEREVEAAQENSDVRQKFGEEIKNLEEKSATIEEACEKANVVDDFVKNDTFEGFEPKELNEAAGEIKKQTPERRLTFEMEGSVNSIEVLRRDSEQFSILEKANHASVRGGKLVKKKKKSTENRNLRKKVDLLVNSTPPNDLNLTFSDEIKDKNNSIIVISSDSSAENTPVKSIVKEKNKNKFDLLKHTLTKKYNSNLVNLTNSENSFRRKMPDFAALHQKQFEQMEDIAAMTKRKAERAKLLLSGSKPTPLKTRNHIESPNVKNKLIFEKTTADATLKQLFSTPENHKSSPLVQFTLPNTSKNKSTFQSGAVERKRNPSTPKVRFTPDTRGSPQITLPKTPKPENKLSYKERRKTKEGFTRYGFKKILPVERMKKPETLAVANKAKPTDVSSREKRKEVLKGVRSNRRFELLMAMRKGKA